MTELKGKLRGAERQGGRDAEERLEIIKEYLNAIPCETTEYDDRLAARVVQKVVIAGNRVNVELLAPSV